MVACTLAFDLDRENARYLVPSTRMHRWNLWPRCLVREGGYFIVRDFVAFAKGEVDEMLTLGYLFLRYIWLNTQLLNIPLIHPPSQVLLNRLLMDLNHLCDLVERLSGLFIMAYRVYFRGILHNVTLPRSWLINLLRPHLNLRKHTSTILPFTRTIVELMRRIAKQIEQYSPFPSDTGDQFRADGGRVTNITGPLYIARM